MKKYWTLITSLFSKPKSKAPVLPTPEPKPAPDTPVFLKVSQTMSVINALLEKRTISVNELKSIGITRTTKVVSELRKKGWQIKTQLLVVNGRKEDIFYILIVPDHLQEV